MNKISRDEPDCRCIGDTLTFECTVMSGSATIWRGSAFNCASSNNEIHLTKSSVDDNNICNRGMIKVQVIGHNENISYTSQLNVTLSTDLIGQTIECLGHNGSDIMEISNTTLDIGMQACTSLTFRLQMRIQMQFHFHHLMQFP